jgi:hypothetical protein
MAAPTAAEVDRLLAAWDERLRRMDDNLLALEADPTYRLCEGGRAKLEGLTRERLGPALSGVTALFGDRERLGEVIDRARAVRTSMSALTFWDNDERQAEIATLLLGESIVDAEGPTSLAGRRLLDDGVRVVKVSPDVLLARMSATFDAARDALALVARTWSKIEPKLAESRERLRRIEQDDLASGMAAELDVVRQVLLDVESRVARDPLGAADEVHREVEAPLARVEASLTDARAARGRLDTAVSEARALLSEATRVHGEARRALDAVVAEIALGPGVASLAADDAAVTDLSPWLDRLVAASQRGHVGPAEIGLSRFRDAAAATLGKDRAALTRVATLRERRDELEGRVSARRAQLRARSGDPRLFERLAEAERLLRERPCRLAEATEAVESFEAAMRGLSAAVDAHFRLRSAQGQLTAGGRHVVAAPATHEARVAGVDQHALEREHAVEARRADASIGFIGIRFTLTFRSRSSFASFRASTTVSFFPATSVYSMVIRRRLGSG